MRITLTGATGFIGEPLVRRLVSEGHDLTILARRPREGSNPRYIRWDSTAGEPPVEALASADAVVNLAGEPVAQRWTAAAKRRIRESRIDGTRRLVDALGRLDARPKTLISASAIGIYGERGDEILTESSSVAAGFLEGVTRDWEAEADRAREWGMRVVKPRIGLVLGAGGGALKKMMLPFRLGVGGRIGSGRQWMSWIHIEDLVGILVFALGNDKIEGPINGTAPNPVRNSDFTREFAGALHRPAFLPVPQFALRLLYGEMADVVVASQRVIPHAAQRAGYRFRYTDVGAALREVVSR